MNSGILSLTNLSTGEVLDTSHKLPDNKFPIRGYKMYNKGVKKLINILSKTEFNIAIDIYSANTIDYYNILLNPFKSYTETLTDSSRSRFKRKLLDNNIIGEYNKKIMLNPYTFLPRGDKNIRNCNYLTQQVWRYMFEDMSQVDDAILEHAKLILGDISLKQQTITVGDKEHKKTMTVPKEVK